MKNLKSNAVIFLLLLLTACDIGLLICKKPCGHEAVGIKGVKVSVGVRVEFSVEDKCLRAGGRFLYGKSYVYVLLI